MPEIHQTLDMTPIGAIFHIVKTPGQTNGQSLEMVWELLPYSGGTPLHKHPSADETYKVLEGELEVNTNGQWQILKPGDEMTIPKGIPHTFRNAADTITKVYNMHTPALRYEAYFVGLHDIVNKLSEGGKKPLKMNLRVATHIAMLMKKYSPEIVSINPPNFIMSLLNWIGKIRGLKI